MFGRLGYQGTQTQYGTSYQTCVIYARYKFVAYLKLAVILFCGWVQALYLKPWAAEKNKTNYSPQLIWRSYPKFENGNYLRCRYCFESKHKDDYSNMKERFKIAINNTILELNKIYKK